MELRQLRYFVEIAEQGSFTKAAETLAVAQPALSTQIRKLEAEFSAKLFVRTKHGVALTGIGSDVLAQARRAIDEADATKRTALIAGDAASARLGVGFTRFFPFVSIGKILRAVRGDHPNVRIDLTETDSDKQIDLVRGGALDIGFVHFDATADYRNLEVVEMSTELLSVVVSNRHRFAARRQIALAELADEEFIMQTSAHTDIRNRLLAVCRRAGFEPRIVQESDDFSLRLGLVAAGMGVALVSSGARALRVRGLHFISVVPRHSYRYAAIYRRGVVDRLLGPYLPRGERPLPDEGDFEI
jgi:DNA-binding transcriptional LysR family regulator